MLKLWNSMFILFYVIITVLVNKILLESIVFRRA